MVKILAQYSECKELVIIHLSDIPIRTDKIALKLSDRTYYTTVRYFIHHKRRLNSYSDEYGIKISILGLEKALKYEQYEDSLLQYNIFDVLAKDSSTLTNKVLKAYSNVDEFNDYNQGRRIEL